MHKARYDYSNNIRSLAKTLKKEELGECRQAGECQEKMWVRKQPQQH